MKRVFYIVVVIVLLIGLSLTAIYFNDRETTDVIKITCTMHENIAAGKGVAYGSVGLYKGNCMPGPGRTSCGAGGVKAAIYVTRPAEKYENSLLVSSATTDENGCFELDLEPGNYSLFVYDNLPEWEQWTECKFRTLCDDNGAYICGGHWDCPEGECTCNPFTIEEGKGTEVKGYIDHAAW